MTKLKAEERVRLMQDVPELGLRRGDTGVVCSTWFDPAIAFEVEFEPEAGGCPVRALLMPDQIQKGAKAWTTAPTPAPHGGLLRRKGRINAVRSE